MSLFRGKSERSAWLLELQLSGGNSDTRRDFSIPAVIPPESNRNFFGISLYDRRRLGLLSRVAGRTLHAIVGAALGEADAVPGVISLVQSFGSLAHWHPHSQYLAWFRGGATTTVTLPRPLTAQQQRATHAHVRQEIDVLLDEYTDAQVAHRLNERGRRTGAGDAFDPASVRWVRFSVQLKSLKERLLEAGMLTKRQLSAQLGVSRTTLGRWRQEGRLRARIYNDLGEWLYRPPEQPPSPTSPSPDPMVNSTVGGAV